MSTNGEPKIEQDMADDVGGMNGKMLLYIAAMAQQCVTGALSPFMSSALNLTDKQLSLLNEALSSSNKASEAIHRCITMGESSESHAEPIYALAQFLCEQADLIKAAEDTAKGKGGTIQ